MIPSDTAVVLILENRSFDQVLGRLKVVYLELGQRDFVDQADRSSGVVRELRYATSKGWRLVPLVSEEAVRVTAERSVVVRHYQYFPLPSQAA